MRRLEARTHSGRPGDLMSKLFTSTPISAHQKDIGRAFLCRTHDSRLRLGDRRRSSRSGGESAGGDALSMDRLLCRTQRRWRRQRNKFHFNSRSRAPTYWVTIRPWSRRSGAGQMPMTCLLADRPAAIGRPVHSCSDWKAISTTSTANRNSATTPTRSATASRPSPSRNRSPQISWRPFARASASRRIAT